MKAIGPLQNSNGPICLDESTLCHLRIWLHVWVWVWSLRHATNRNGSQTASMGRSTFVSSQKDPCTDRRMPSSNSAVSRHRTCSSDAWRSYSSDSCSNACSNEFAIVVQPSRANAADHKNKYVRDGTDRSDHCRDAFRNVHRLQFVIEDELNGMHLLVVFVPTDSAKGDGSFRHQMAHSPRRSPAPSGVADVLQRNFLPGVHTRAVSIEHQACRRSIVDGQKKHPMFVDPHPTPCLYFDHDSYLLRCSIQNLSYCIITH